MAIDVPATVWWFANNGMFLWICAKASVSYFFMSLCWSLSSRKKDKGIYDDTKKLVVVSGCDRGLGRILVERLLAENSDIIVLALALTQEAAKELNSSKLKAIQCDVTKKEEVERMKEHVEGLVSTQAVLYAIINNAGIVDPGDFLWYPDLEQHRRVMEVNFFGQLRVTQALLPIMLRTSTGLTHGARILNMSSVCGTSSSPGNSAYTASKFAVEAWSDSLRIELDPFNIQVVKVRPGQTGTQIQTDFVKNLFKNYKGAPSEIRLLYGGDAYSKNMTNALKTIAKDASPTNPDIVVDAMMKVIAVEHTKPHYWIGQDAQTLWKALHMLPTRISDALKRKQFYFAPLAPPDKPPKGVISHVTIRVRNIDRSFQFYRKFGFEALGESRDKQQVLHSGKSSKLPWRTLILLQEDESMSRRSECFNIGMTRLSLYTDNLDDEVNRLSQEEGLEPIAPCAKDNVAMLTAYRDPDNFVVYLIQFRGLRGGTLRTHNTLVAKMEKPIMFHWTLNVTNAKAALAAFEALGFKTLSDQNKDEVRHDLLPGFGIDASTTVIEHIRLCKLPNDFFIATIMEWVNPKSEKRGDEILNSMSISVEDVKAAIQRAEKAGLQTEKPTRKWLPLFGQVIVGSAFVEPGCNRIEFCQFEE